MLKMSSIALRESVPLEGIENGASPTSHFYPPSRYQQSHKESFSRLFIMFHTRNPFLISPKPGVVHVILDVVGKVLAGSDSDVDATDSGPGHAASQTLFPTGGGLKEQSGGGGGGDGVGRVILGIAAFGNEDAERGIHERHHAQHLRRGRRSLRHIVKNLRSSESAAIIGLFRL